MGKFNNGAQIIVVAPDAEAASINAFLKENWFIRPSINPEDFFASLSAGDTDAIILSGDYELAGDILSTAALFPDIPVIFLQSARDGASLAPFSEAEALIFPLKQPYSKEELGTVLSSALAVGRRLQKQRTEIHALKAVEKRLQQRLATGKHETQHSEIWKTQSGVDMEFVHDTDEERFRLAARATNDIIWDFDFITNSVYWSHGEGGSFAADSQGIRQESWESEVHPDDRERVLESFRAALLGQENRWSARYRYRKEEGRYIEVLDRGFIIRDEEGRPVRMVGAITDLSERSRAEAELHRLQSELIHVSRVSAMGTMASTLAHELNQPLTAVASYVRGSHRLLGSAGARAIPQTMEALEAAEAGAIRAGRIVRKLREFVARGNVTVKPEPVAQLIEEACELGFLDAHLMGVTHSIRIDPTARWVSADRIQVQQVLINLIRNALQAMQNEERREVEITTTALSNGQVKVSIADTGCGLLPDIRDALFSPFKSNKPDGMGIGLSISRTIVEAHGGKIWAEDREGGGTIFSFTLLRCDGEESSQDDRKSLRA